MNRTINEANAVRTISIPLSEAIQLLNPEYVKDLNRISSSHISNSRTLST